LHESAKERKREKDTRRKDRRRVSLPVLFGPLRIVLSLFRAFVRNIGHFNNPATVPPAGPFTLLLKRLTVCYRSCSAPQIGSREAQEGLPEVPGRGSSRPVDLDAAGHPWPQGAGVEHRHGEAETRILYLLRAL
jgi:hypothetical protein